MMVLPACRPRRPVDPSGEGKVTSGEVEKGHQLVQLVEQRGELFLQAKQKLPQPMQKVVE